MTLDEIKMDIVAACSEFRAAGYEVVTKDYAKTDTGTCEGKVCGGCALTAVLVTRGKKPLAAPRWIGVDAEGFAALRYGWNEREIGDFVRGFDGDHRGYMPGPTYELGRAVRAEVGLAG